MGIGDKKIQLFANLVNAVAEEVEVADARGEEGDDAREDGAHGLPVARATVHDHGEALSNPS